MMATQRESSRQNWASQGTIAEINSGSLQRIADATEIMAQNFVTLQKDRDWYKGRTNELTDANVRLHRRIAAL
jgi:hypothetical protein